MKQEDFNQVTYDHRLYMAKMPNGKCADLRDKDLRECNVEKLQLPYADLQHTNMSGMHFFNVDFTGANLCYADLTDCTMERTTFRDANLRKAKLGGIDFRKTSLQGVVGNGREVKSLHVNEHFSMAYTKDTFWVGCFRLSLEDWRGWLDDPSSEVDGKTMDFTKLEDNPRGNEFRDAYFHENKYFLIDLVTKIDPADG